MSKISKVLIIGSGPIVIGQAAGFDYAGTRACKALRDEDVTTMLVHSNPATIMRPLKKRCRTFPAGGLGASTSFKKVPQDWGIRGLIETISAVSL